MTDFIESIICRTWLRVSNRSALGLLDAIKQSFYGYGYSLYSIEEDGLDKEYKFLVDIHLIELKRNILTGKETSICPMKKGLRIGRTSEEKQKFKEIIIKVVWVLLSGIIVAVIGGVILHFIIGATT